MIEVIKRDGEIAEFNLNKITEAIKKAFKATKKDFTHEILELLSLRVTADFQSKMEQGKISVEQIRTAWSMCWRRPAILTLPRPTFYTGSRERKSAT